MASPPFDILNAKPGDTDLISQHPADERSMRDIVESWLLIDHDTSGLHNKVQLPERADPSSVANVGILYSKDVSGISELHYIDSAGTVIQLTSAGNIFSEFPANTLMLFQQTLAPTGWTKETTHNNKALRLTTGTVTTGGATAFATVFGSSKTAGSHTLTIAEMPSHDHDVTIPALDSNVLSGTSVPVPRETSTVYTTTLTGGGGGHTHTLSLDLQFVDFIIAKKD